jgi:hypothetical protein
MPFFQIGLGPIVLDFPYISEELTDKSNQVQSIACIRVLLSNQKKLLKLNLKHLKLSDC